MMRETLTFVAAAVSAMLYFNKPDKEQPVEQVAPPPAVCCGDDCDCCDCDIDAVIERVAKLEASVAKLQQLTAAKPEALPAPAPVAKAEPVKVVPQVVAPKPAAVVKQTLTAENYNPRWQNFDGKDRMRHAAEDHGIDVSKHSQAEVLRMMDADHDRYGGSAHAAIKASRNAVVYQSSTLSTPLRTYSQQTYSNCPGGVCPAPAVRSQPVVRRGLLGWRR